MDSQVGVPKKKSRRNPVIIPVSLVNEGCGRIAENMSELTYHALRFLNLSDEIVSRRVAQILVIHAMDEAGKLLEIVRKTIHAESTGADSISIEGFYSHSRKGAQAGDMGILAVNWLQARAERIFSVASGLTNALDDYRNHLKSLKIDFTREREDALYVDFEDGKWSSPTAHDESWIFFDAYLLGMLAAVTLDTINAGRSVRDLDTLAMQLNDTSVLRELERRVKESGIGGERP